jgi:hypothetical protein
VGWFSGSSDYEKRLQVVAEQVEKTGQWTKDLISEFNKCVPKIDQTKSPSMAKLNLLMQQTAARAEESDYFRWGGWDPNLHSDFDQEKRYNRAVKIDDDDVDVDFEDGTGQISGYTVYLNHCTCSDFDERKLPCKHIYRLALELDLPI